MTLLTLSLAVAAMLMSHAVVVRGGDDDEDAAEVVAMWAFKICKEQVKGVKDDGTVWHWTKYLCNDVQEQTEEYMKEMIEQTADTYLKKAGAANARVHDAAVETPVREALAKVLKRVITEKTKDAGQIKNSLADAFAPLASVFTYWLTGKHSYLKSEKVPSSQGAVTVVVGKTFKKLVTERQNDVLLEFYAHWCQHCQELEPKWDQLGRLFKGTPVTIAKIESTRNDFPENFTVNGYPTIFFAPRNGEPVLYEGEREVADFVNFIELHRTDKSFKMPDVPVVKSDVVVLTDDNFADTQTGSWFVKFYAPWCGHCKSLAPTWSELATSELAKPSGGFKVAKIDCTGAGKKSCEAHKIPGFPTLKAFVDGKAIEFQGHERSLEAFGGFLAQHSGGAAAAHDEL